MTALLRLIGIGALLMAVVAFQDRENSRWVVAGLAALGAAALLLARTLTIYFRYRQAFAQARRGNASRIVIRFLDDGT